MSLAKSALLILWCASMAGAGQVHADACIDFKWDVQRERALFATAPIAVSAGSDLKSAPALTPGHLYRVTLMPQNSVRFAAAPARAGGDEAYAGLALLKLPADANYRVSLDLPVWIDVVSNGALVEAKDFQGQHDCNAPHKIVEFELKAAKPLVLQLSRSSAGAVLVTITAAPVRVL
jgi:hypothetical protein